MNARRRGIKTQPIFAPFLATGLRLHDRLDREWRQTQLYRWTLRGPQTSGLGCKPRNHRPADASVAQSLLLGRMVLAGETMEIGPGGDPWDTASPSRPFAVELHRFSWMPDLLAGADPELANRAAEEGLRLFLDWLSLFSAVSPFVWSAETAERRVFNLACSAPYLMPIASELERRKLTESLAEQARHLLRLDEGPIRAAERAVAAAVAGACLAGRAGDGLMTQALQRVSANLRAAVLPDGGVKSRSPEQGMELLFDLLTLDDALHQRGRAAPPELGRAIDRLSAGVRFFTLGDGRLGAFQGGETATATKVAASVAHEDKLSGVYAHLPHTGYQRLASPDIIALIDVAPPAEGAWSLAACAQPLAFELSCGGDRIFTNTAWSPDAQAPQALRLTDAGNTASLKDTSAGAPLSGLAASGFGARLIGGAANIDAHRSEDEASILVELSHDGWVEPFGLVHERRLFLDLRASELRGEDQFRPAEPGKARQKLDPFALRFHLAPEVQVSLARDKRSVLLRGLSNRGWWFRNDAPDVSLEPSVHMQDRQPRRSFQIVLRGQVSLDGAARVRWKLTPVDSMDASLA